MEPSGNVVQHTSESKTKVSSIRRNTKNTTFCSVLLCSLAGQRLLNKRNPTTTAPFYRSPLVKNKLCGYKLRASVKSIPTLIAQIAQSNSQLKSSNITHVNLLFTLCNGILDEVSSYSGF